MSNWQTQMVETNRGTFEVFIKGEGAPLCVTHMYSSYNETGDRFAEMFTKQHQVFLVNLKDAGNSPRVQDIHELSMENTVKDLEAIRERLGFEKWAFAGHSTGGMIGALYGILHSASLDSLILVGSAAKNYTQSKDCMYHREHPLYQKGQDLLNQLQHNPDLSAEDRARFSIERTKLSLYRPERYEEYFSGPYKKGFLGHRLTYFSIHEMQTFDLYEQLPQISTRTLILCGRHDVQCPVCYSIDMHEWIEHSQLVIFEESNHYPFLEEPEKFAAAVEAFYR